MTSEVAILNKEAIALAADSAIKLGGGPGMEKIFTSANKIFTLSKYHPIGIMIYASAEFMKIPWETLIKLYRRKLGKKKFDTLEMYTSDFLNFLRNANDIFTEILQMNLFEGNVYGFFDMIKTLIIEDIQKIIAENGQITIDEIKEVISSNIQEHYDKWNEGDVVPSMSETSATDLIEKYGTIIDNAKQETFEGLPIDDTISNQLTGIAVNLFLKFPEGITPPGSSGVIITGFGEKELFPSLRSFLIERVVNNQLKYKEGLISEITNEKDAIIAPFAQQEMIYAFMEGVDPRYQLAIEEDLSQICDEFPEILVDNIENLSDDEKTHTKEDLKEILEGKLEEYKEKLREYRIKTYITPVLGVVGSLPKDELAAMAESLVSLTLFKRRVTWEVETVREPIDVAVISKGDGFIWIKRKHYFKADLNPQFFENYYLW